jgi:hypothetical protein
VIVPLSRRTRYASESSEPVGDLRGIFVIVPSIGVVESVGQTRTCVPGGKGSGTCGLASR